MTRIYKFDKNYYKIGKINDFLTNCDLDPPYQRGFVWDDDKSSKYIQSIYRRIACFPLVFSENAGTYICIDGKQRINAIKKFINNEITFELNNEKIYYSQKKNARKLNDEELKYFNDIDLEIINFNKLSYIEQIDIFKRINSGTQLTEGELIMELFSDKTVADKFKNFCDSKKKSFGKYADVKKGEHILQIANILFIVSLDDGLRDINKSVKLFLFESLTHEQLDEYLEITSCIIDNLYNNNLLNSKSLVNMVGKHILLPLIQFVKDEKKYIDSSKLLNVITNLHIDDKSTSKDNLQKIYNNIKMKYKDMDEILEISDDDAEEEEKKKKINKNKKKENVPKPLKKQIWNKYVGVEEGESICQCCKSQIIDKNDFSCGHIIAEKNGGTLDLENIRPICKSCNSSMGTTDMRAFMKKYGFGDLPKDKKYARELYKQKVNNNFHRLNEQQQ